MSSATLERTFDPRTRSRWVGCRPTMRCCTTASDRHAKLHSRRIARLSFCWSALQCDTHFGFEKRERALRHAMRVMVLQFYGTFILLLIYAFLDRNPSSLCTALYNNDGVRDMPSTSQLVQCVRVRPGGSGSLSYTDCTTKCPEVRFPQISYPE